MKNIFLASQVFSFGFEKQTSRNVADTTFKQRKYVYLVQQKITYTRNTSQTSYTRQFVPIATKPTWDNLTDALVLVITSRCTTILIVVKDFILLFDYSCSFNCFRNCLMQISKIILQILFAVVPRPLTLTLTCHIICFSIPLH